MIETTQEEVNNKEEWELVVTKRKKRITNIEDTETQQETNTQKLTTEDKVVKETTQINKWKISFTRNEGDRGKRMGTASKRVELRRRKAQVGETLLKAIEMRKKKTWKEDENMRTDIKIVSHNIRGGIGTQTKVEDLAEYLEEESPDIMMIQEAKIRKGDTEKIRIPQDYEIYSAEAKTNKGFRQRGVMTLIKKTLANRVINSDIIKDEEGRILVIPIQTLVTGQRMWIMNMYAPASQEENSINILQSQLENIEVEEQGNNNENTEEEEEATKVEKAKFYNTKMAKIQQEIEKRASAQDVIIAGLDANAIMDNTTDMR